MSGAPVPSLWRRRLRGGEAVVLAAVGGSRGRSRTKRSKAEVQVVAGLLSLCCCAVQIRGTTCTARHRSHSTNETLSFFLDEEEES